MPESRTKCRRRVILDTQATRACHVLTQKSMPTSIPAEHLSVLFSLGPLSYAESVRQPPPPPSRSVFTAHPGHIKGLPTSSRRRGARRARLQSHLREGETVRVCVCVCPWCRGTSSAKRGTRKGVGAVWLSAHSAFPLHDMKEASRPGVVPL